MSESRTLSERERAFEAVYFQKESERLIEAMRERKSREQQSEALAQVLGVDSHDLIDRLLDLGLRAENATALVLAPLVMVAWADHKIHKEEKKAILKAEEDFDIDADSDAGRLLEVWLDHRPHESLLDVWAGYVGELCQAMEPEERAKLRDDIVNRAERIARAIDKTFLRAGGPSETEKALLDRIASAFG